MKIVAELLNGEEIEELLQNLRNCQSEPNVILYHTEKLVSHQDFPGLDDGTIATVKSLQKACKRLLTKCTSCLEYQTKLRDLEARVERLVVEKKSGYLLAEKFLSYPKGNLQRLFAVFELQSTFSKEAVTKEIEMILKQELSLASCTICKTMEEEKANILNLLTLLA
mmetsp:Transcript_16109/g.18247  ORF Transcript_16109/g.18247 Transcript_16109/m.18247 type:complete len:167 (-) Transcript_16109:1665-2165(-)